MEPTRRHLIVLFALTAVLALGLAATAAGKREVVRVGNIILSDDGGIFPSKLPRHGSAPITARLIGQIATADGTHPPALTSVSVEVSKTIGIDAAGLPVCRASQIQATDTEHAKQACPDAIVGSGTAEVEVAFAEQLPLLASGPVEIFNGGVKGKVTTVLLHAYVSVPAPTAIVTVATVTRIDDGPYGLRIDARIPRIAGGSGSVRKFDLKVGRRYTYKGRPKSYLSAGCPSGHWSTSGHVLFTDGTRLGIDHVFPCTPTG